MGNGAYYIGQYMQGFQPPMFQNQNYGQENVNWKYIKFQYYIFFKNIV